MKRFLSLVLMLMMCLTLVSCQKEAPVATEPTGSPAAAEVSGEEASAEPIVATVNGENLLYSEYIGIESAYMYQYEAAGVDFTNPDTYAYLQDLALTYAIEQLLIKQDMRAQGCYDFDTETEAWFQETGKAAYDQAVQDVMNTMRTADSSEDELMVYALAYAKSLNVTEETYVDFYRTQYASARYYEWLIRENPVTDADVLSSYAERVTLSEGLYANDIAAFETAMNTGAEVWYKPAGYRSVLQILLPAEGVTPEVGSSSKIQMIP